MASKDDIVRMMGLSAPQTMPEAALDDEGVRGIDVGVELSPADELEAGIAAVFDAIRSSDEHPDDGAEADDAESDDTPPEDTGVTFALLTELNRLWERPPA
jgi:hypothetical protein